MLSEKYRQNRNFERVESQTNFRRPEIGKLHFHVILVIQVQSINYYRLNL